MDDLDRSALEQFMLAGASPERAMADLQGFGDALFAYAFGRPIDDTRLCQNRGHLLAREGCTPGKKPEYVIELVHPRTAHTLQHADPHYELACSGHVAWLRDRWTRDVHCDTCDVTATTSDWTRIVGMIERPTA